MTDETPTHGCTINGQPAMPIRVDEYNQLVAENNRLASELGDYDQRVEQLTSELAALRAVARGYCPACGRGDAAPTTDDWEQQKQRADQAEAERDELRDENAAVEAKLSDMARKRGEQQWRTGDAERRVRVQRERADEAEQQLRLTDAMRQQNLDAAATAIQRAERAERERDEARQHAAAIAAQRDRLRQRMHALADQWDAALAVDKPYARTLRAEISVAPFHPDVSLVVQPYRADDGTQKWAVRCWGTDTCDGFLSLDHDSQQWAERARDRHAAEAHAALDEPAAGTTATSPAPGPYRHYKGGTYDVVATATHTETGDRLVIYRSGGGCWWARPADHFTSPVDGQPRFTPAGTATQATGEPTPAGEARTDRAYWTSRYEEQPDV